MEILIVHFEIMFLLSHSGFLFGEPVTCLIGHLEIACLSSNKKRMVDCFEADKVPESSSIIDFARSTFNVKILLRLLSLWLPRKAQLKVWIVPTVHHTFIPVRLHTQFILECSCQYGWASELWVVNYTNNLLIVCRAWMRWTYQGYGRNV